MKKRIVSVMAALVCLITLVVGAVPVSAEDNLPHGRYVEGYEILSEDVIKQCWAQSISNDQDSASFYYDISFSSMGYIACITESGSSNGELSLLILWLPGCSDATLNLLSDWRPWISGHYEANCSAGVGYGSSFFSISSTNDNQELNLYNYGYVSGYFWASSDASLYPLFSSGEAHEFRVFTNLNIGDISPVSNYLSYAGPPASFVSSDAPFEASFSGAGGEFGLNMSREITISGKQGNSWTDVNNQLNVNISLSDSFLSRSAESSELDDMTYGVVVTIGTEPISEAENISDFLCDKEKTLFTAYNGTSDNYYYEGSSSEMLSFIDRLYYTSSDDDKKGFSESFFRGSGSHTSRVGYIVDKSTNSYDPTAEKEYFTFKRCSGFTPIFTLRRDRPVGVSIDLSHVPDLVKNKSYYINVVGVATYKPSYFSNLLSDFYVLDGDLDLGSYCYRDDFLELSTNEIDNWLVNFNSVSDYSTKEFYYCYTVSSEAFSYEDYPAYEPLTTSYIDDNGFTQTVKLGESFEETLGLPPKFQTDRKVKAQVGGTGDVDPEKYDRMKDEEVLNENVQTFKFDTSTLSSLFDGSSSLFKFLTSCISILPSSFMGVLLSFFGIFLAIVLIKFVF